MPPTPARVPSQERRPANQQPHRQHRQLTPPPTTPPPAEPAKEPWVSDVLLAGCKACADFGMETVRAGMDLLKALIAIIPLAVEAFSKARNHHYPAVAGRFVVAGLGVIMCYAFLFSLLPYVATQLKEHREFAANQTEAARQHEREMAVLAHNHTMQLAFRQEFGAGTLRLHQPDGNVFELVSMCPAPQMTVQTCALETEPALLCPRSTLSPPPTAGRAARLPVTILPRTSSACGSAWSRSPAASV